MSIFAPATPAAQARLLLACVEGLVAGRSEGYVGRAVRLRNTAQNWGAHSIARALFWSIIPEVIDERPRKLVDERLLRVARNYLARVEVREFRGWGVDMEKLGS